MKRLFSFLFSIAMLLCCLGCNSEPTTPTVTDGTLLVSVFKLGEPQDAILLQTTKSAVLIDTGITENAASVVRALNQAGITRLDALIITHFDQDHVGGADAVLSSLTVDSIYTPDYTVDTPEYNAFVTAADQKGITPIAVSEAITLTFDGVRYDIDATQKEVKPGEDNNMSLITTVTHGQNRLLFMGDAENARLKEFNKTEPAPVAFIKMPHHGRYHKALKDLLSLTAPDYSCITCSNQERAEEKTLALLKEKGVTNFNVSDGTVYASSDGHTVTVWQ